VTVLDATKQLVRDALLSQDWTEGMPSSAVDQLTQIAQLQTYPAGRVLLNQVKSTMQHNGVESVSSIRIEIGPLAGVEPLLVEQAFCALVPETEFANTRLVVFQPKLMAVCRDCQHEFEVSHFQFSCPTCASTKVQVTSGNQLRLLSITTELHEPTNVSLGAIDQ